MAVSILSAATWDLQLKCQQLLVDLKHTQWQCIRLSSEAHNPWSVVGCPPERHECLLPYNPSAEHLNEVQIEAA